MFFLHKDAFSQVIDLWEEHMHVYTVQGTSEDAHFLRHDTHSPHAMLMPEQYIHTVMSPKAFIFAEREALFRWEIGEHISVHSAQKQQRHDVLLVGVRPCDAYGLAYTHFFYESEYTDMFCAARHRRLFVVSIDCTQAGKHCFCTANNGLTGPHVYASDTHAAHGSDVQMTPDSARHGYWLQSHSAKGQWLLTLAAPLLHADLAQEGRTRVATILQETLERWAPTTDFRTLPQAFRKGFNHPLWEDIAPHCIACTGCTRVCPTCTCFTTDEEIYPAQGHADHKERTGGLRVRHWDSCQSEGFTRNAGWHNPRSFTAAVRYRLYDKLVYIEKRFGRKGCTGCGRCIAVCPASINMVHVAEQLMREYAPEVPEHAAVEAPVPFVRHARAFDPQLYVPDVAEIIEIYDEAATIRRFTLRPLHGRCLGKPALRGQFYMISDFGVGEVAISVPFSDSTDDNLVFYIKKAGKVTASLFQKRVGDMLGVRGPYGQPFPYAAFKGRNIIVAGSGVGYAPVRSPLLRAIENKHDFGDIVILASALTYEELMLKEDLKAWAQVPGVRVLYALAKPTDAVDAHVGYMNDLLPTLGLDLAQTSAIVCASARRIKAVAKDLMALGMAPTDIYTALETHMRCGVGKCGHCKVGAHFMCTDGPVFTYAEMLAMPPEF